MKPLFIKALVILTALFSVNQASGQTTTLTIEVKDIKEVKGNILVMLKNSDNPQQVFYQMTEVKQEEATTVTFNAIPVVKVDISIFQDLNNNNKLDIDEQNIPVEPCYTKEKVKLKEEPNKLSVKLMNIKELMAPQR